MTKAKESVAVKFHILCVPWLNHVIHQINHPSSTLSARYCLPQYILSCLQVGSGYTYKELDARGRQFARFWRRFDKSKPPCGMSEKCVFAAVYRFSLMLVNRMRLVMPGFKEAPDVWIEPEDSMVVQIKAAEIAPSDK